MIVLDRTRLIGPLRTRRLCAQPAQPRRPRLVRTPSTASAARPNPIHGATETRPNLVYSNFRQSEGRFGPIVSELGVLQLPTWRGPFGADFVRSWCTPQTASARGHAVMAKLRAATPCTTTERQLCTKRCRTPGWDAAPTCLAKALRSPTPLPLRTTAGRSLARCPTRSRPEASPGQRTPRLAWKPWERLRRGLRAARWQREPQARRRGREPAGRGRQERALPPRRRGRRSQRRP